ncbi:putative toxin-antitoxin system toxin component, PIN family [Frisingicoccus sp.]|uniref:putative toxin-antitoxin system toxin component, PIN family n=1 Tax=Frisingicoccus sp. TaxID=1918627 RepID=UPI003AB5DD31
MICYAVIDTNVLVSALLSSNDMAATVQVVGRMIAGQIVPIYSREIMNEYEEVLNRKKFNFPRKMVRYVLKLIGECGIFVEPQPMEVILPDIKDLPFYEVVMEKRKDGAYLVTGNLKHFPKEPYIVTARQLIDILDANKE